MGTRLVSARHPSAQVRPPRSLAAVTDRKDTAPDRPRRRAERLLGATAEPSATRPPRARPESPRAVRWAALVVGVQAAALVVAAGVLAYLTLTESGGVASGLALAALVLVLGAALAGCAVGMWRGASWARGPVIAGQLLLGLMGYTAAVEAHRPAIGIPALALVALVFYLLATPEARLAFFRRRD
jgi:hypothetical protein